MKLVLCPHPLLSLRFYLLDTRASDISTGCPEISLMNYIIGFVYNQLCKYVFCIISYFLETSTFLEFTTLDILIHMVDVSLLILFQVLGLFRVGYSRLEGE